MLLIAVTIFHYYIVILQLMGFRVESYSWTSPWKMHLSSSLQLHITGTYSQNGDKYKSWFSLAESIKHIFATISK